MHTFTQTRSPLAPNANAHPLDVVTIKSALGALGHYEAPEWGISQFPDGDLFRAIQAFQKAQGLKTDGVIKPDGETLAALQGKLKGAKARTATQTTALALQDMGRNGDEILAHLTPAEAQLLHDITDGGSINPETGLLEFWGRLGGSKASRARREKAENRAASADRVASGNQRSGDWDSDNNRTLGYNDFNPGGMHGGKNRNGTKKTGVALEVHNRAMAAQQAALEKAANEQRIQAQLHADAQRAKEQKAAGAQRQHEQDLSREAARAQNYDAMTATEKDNTLSRMQSTKRTKAPAKGFHIADTAAATTPATKAQAQPTQGARTSTTTPQTPQGKDISPSWGPTATPAQQARNILHDKKVKEDKKKAEEKVQQAAAKAKLAAEKQLTTTAPKTRTYTAKQREIEAEANAVNAIGRRRVNDYLAMKSKTPPGQTAAQARKATWSVAKGLYQNNKTTRAAQRQGKPIAANWSQALTTLHSAPQEQYATLAAQLTALTARTPSMLSAMPGELADFVGAYTAHKQNISGTPARPRADDPKYKGSAKKFSIAIRNYEKHMATNEADAVRAGVNAAASRFSYDAFSGPVTQAGVDMYAGGKALIGDAMAAEMSAGIKAGITNMVPENYRRAPTVTLARGAGTALGFLGKLNPLGGPLAAAGESATATMQQGGSQRGAKTGAYGAAGLDLLGGKLTKGPMAIAKNLAKPALKGAAPRTLRDLLRGTTKLDPSLSANAWSAAEQAAGYAGGTGLGLLADKEDTNRAGKTSDK